MITKLRNNFKFSNVLSKVLFVLTFAFANWQQASATVALFSEQNNTLLAIACCLVVAVAMVLILPFAVDFLLKTLKLYNLPTAEYTFLVTCACAFGFLLCGLLNLVHLFTPIFLAWGGVLFPFVSTLLATLLFYKVTAKLYFNDVTVVHYFRSVGIMFVVLVFVTVVL